MLAALARLAPRARLVWDLGCNTGEYSLLASTGAALTVAMDGDEVVVDDLCRRCEQDGVLNILPLVVDLANPSPAQGWRGVERRALIERGVPDLCLVLALIHHLVLAQGVPADELLEELSRTGRYCLFEHVSPKDPMAERLRGGRGEGGNELPDREAFEQLASRHFSVQEVTPLTDTRALYLLRSRGPVDRAEPL